MSPISTVTSDLDRFLAMVNIQPDGCWLWTGYIDRGGYGIFSIKSKPLKAHRFAYEFYNGSIPASLTIDHRCRNRACVNPSHLRLLTNQENCLAGDTGKHNAIKTHCPQGHPYNEHNTYMERLKDGRLVRRCRLCRNARQRRRRRELCQ